MGVVVMTLLLIAAGGGAYYVYKQQEEATQPAPAEEGQVAGDSTKPETKKTSFFGTKKTSESGTGGKEEKKSGWSMPKIPDKNSIQMMAMKQSLSGGGLGAAAKMFG